MGTYKVTPVTALDYRRLAEKRLPRFLFDYIEGGANEEDTMAANVADFRRFNLKQRVMCDVGNIDTSTILSGQPASMPLALAPIGIAGMMARRGEVLGARGASAAGIPFTTSTVGICPLEEVQAAVDAPIWFQLYMLRDRELVASLLERAQAAGCETLMFTVDLAVAGLRHRDTRNGMMGDSLAGSLAKAWQVATRPRWIVDVALKGRPHNFGNLREVVSDSNNLNAYKAFVDSQFDPTVTWKDIAWLRSLWKGKILIKGVMAEEDARAAADVGADGVIVSNHGGRQLDGVASSIVKLPEVVAAVGDRVEVYMDGGVRSGIDVVKALALGANGILIGRPWVWAMAGRGQQGLTDLLGVFQQEIAVAMALMGVKRIADITPDLIEENQL
jgi:L-lactate dehydrogenase (cytochrome)